MLFSLFLFITGCGQMGPLYLPKEDHAVQKTAPKTSNLGATATNSVETPSSKTNQQVAEETTRTGDETSSLQVGHSEKLEGQRQSCEVSENIGNDPSTHSPSSDKQVSYQTQ